jgi:hypothetical protein
MELPTSSPRQLTASHPHSFLPKGSGVFCEFFNFDQK